MQNLKEFKELIARYESITLEEIEEKAVYGDPNNDIPFGRKTANLITGFGVTATCTLCKAVNEVCVNCVYFDVKFHNVVHGYHCLDDKKNEETYYAILKAESPEELQKAFIARAKRMREILKEKGLEV